MSNAAFVRLRTLNQQLSNRVCVGIDPDPSAYDDFLMAKSRELPAQQFLETYAHHLVDAAAGKVSAVKFQSAFFEAHGSQGWLALEKSIRYARTKGLLTILDAKRCDIASTMRAYGHAAFEQLGADFLTVVLYMGVGSLDALVPWLRRGHGAYVVLLSSNPEGAALQNLAVEGGATVGQQLLRLIADWQDAAQCHGSIGLVVGATLATKIPEHTKHYLDGFPLLMPGIGAQGAALSPELLDLYQRHPSSLLPISRGLTKGAGTPSAVASKVTNWADFAMGVAGRLDVATAQLI